MKSAELKVLSAELKDRPQGAGNLPRAKVLPSSFSYSALSTQHSVLSTVKV